MAGMVGNVITTLQHVGVGLYFIHMWHQMLAYSLHRCHMQGMQVCPRHIVLARGLDMQTHCSGYASGPVLDANFQAYCL